MVLFKASSILPFCRGSTTSPAWAGWVRKNNTMKKRAVFWHHGICRNVFIGIFYMCLYLDLQRGANKTLRDGELTPVKRNHLAPLWRCWYEWICFPMFFRHWFNLITGISCFSSSILPGSPLKHIIFRRNHQIHRWDNFIWGPPVVRFLCESWCKSMADDDLSKMAKRKGWLLKLIDMFPIFTK